MKLNFAEWLSEGLVHTTDFEGLMGGIAANPTERTTYGVAADYLAENDEDGFRFNFLTACFRDGVACYPTGCFTLSPPRLTDQPRLFRRPTSDSYELAIHCVEGLGSTPRFMMESRYIPDAGSLTEWMLETADMFNTRDKRFNDRLMDYLRCQSETHSNLYPAGSDEMRDARAVERQTSRRANALIAYFVF